MLTNAQDGAESKYLFKIVSNSIKEVEFVADFSGSDNVRIEAGPQGSMASGGMIIKKEIGSKMTEDICEIRLLKGWKLKSKFKFTLKNPPLER